jgi:hypothetical protein
MKIKRERFFQRLAKYFLEISGKCIDELNQKNFDDPLSLIGKLFETYFVRLIGTPNQNSKMIPLRRDRV